MTDDRMKTAPDIAFKPIGVGHHITRWCLGCESKKETPGSRGIGLRWRCAACVAKRVQA